MSAYDVAVCGGGFGGISALGASLLQREAQNQGVKLQESELEK